MAYDLLTKRQTNADWSLGLDEPFVWTPAAVKSELLRVLGDKPIKVRHYGQVGNNRQGNLR